MNHPAKNKHIYFTVEPKTQNNPTSHYPFLKKKRGKSKSKSNSNDISFKTISN